MCPSSSFSACASFAVPSGLLSSTTSTSTSGAAARMRCSSSVMFAGLFVGGHDDHRAHDGSEASGRAITPLIELVQAVAEQALAPGADRAEVALQHLVRLVGTEVERGVRLDPVVADGRQDHDVRRRQVVGQARVGCGWRHRDPSRCSACRDAVCGSR